MSDKPPFPPYQLELAEYTDFLIYILFRTFSNPTHKSNHSHDISRCKPILGFSAHYNLTVI